MEKVENLINEIQAGDNSKLEDLYLQYRSLISKIAYRFCNSYDYDDLFQEGYIALDYAAKHWKPEGGASFLSYAYSCIEWHMILYKREKEGCIFIPSFMRDRVSRYKDAVSRFKKVYGKDPLDEDVMKQLDLTLDQVKDIKRVMLLLDDPISIYKCITDDGDTLLDVIPDPDDPIDDATSEMESEELKAKLWSVVDELPKKESFLLHRRFKDGVTLSACGKELGVSGNRAQQIEKDALRHMRTKRKKLTPFLIDSIESYAYSKGGFSYFKNSNTSSVECAVLRLFDN